MKKVYISGQMSGLPREEYLARFAKAESLLRQEGFAVVNPARLLPSRWPWLYRLMGYRLTLLYDLWRLSRCDLIYKIPGWKESHGANIESCWAYHQNICLLYTKTREKIDKKMAKYIEKRTTVPAAPKTRPTRPPHTLAHPRRLRMGHPRLPAPVAVDRMQDGAIYPR